jgi:hypothetical protein
MRYECDDAAFAGDYVEFSDSFSRGQVKATWVAYGAMLALLNSGADIADDEAEAAEEKLLATLRPKIVALHLTCVDADAITSADDLTPARVADVDTRLWAWWTGVWPKHLNGLSELGNALRRRLQGISAIPVATVEADPLILNHS